jgi:epoxyqueuosine reductase
VAEHHLDRWLADGMQGDMEYMSRHGHKRSRPQQLVAGTTRIISARMDYLPESKQRTIDVLNDPKLAYVSRYAIGRDYHKLMRSRLSALAKRIQEKVGEYGYRVFTDSAPVLEKAIAEKAGLGWIGKHSNLISRRSGSWFFLGEIYTDLPLPVDEPADEHCGTCRACLDVCPTQAIIAPYRVDARLCISYLTIEHKGSIDESLRPMIGNRIYGCDDCQLVCPWNRFSRLTDEPDFMARNGVDSSMLTELFSWSEQQFLDRFEGSAIRRIGYQCWQRNLAVAMGNAPYSSEICNALEQKVTSASEMVVEHIQWAISQQQKKAKDNL